MGQTSEKVVISSCYDGDTCTTSTGEKIRLACIDTPELGVNAQSLFLRKKHETTSENL